MRIEQQVKNSPYGSYYCLYAIINDEGVEIDSFMNSSDATERLVVLIRQKEAAARPAPVKKASLPVPYTPTDLDGWDL